MKDIILRVSNFNLKCQKCQKLNNKNEESEVKKNLKSVSYSFTSVSARFHLFKPVSHSSTLLELTQYNNNKSETQRKTSEYFFIEKCNSSNFPHFN